MSEVLARQGIMTAMAAAVTAHTSYPLVVEADNRKLVDQVAQSDPYIQISIAFMSAEQSDMADHPIVRQMGQIILAVAVKEGTGTAAGAALRDFIRPYFSMKNLGIVRTHAAEIYSSKTHMGWEYTPLLINFWYHDVST